MTRKVIDTAFTALFALQSLGSLVTFAMQQFAMQQMVREAIAAQYALLYSYVFVMYWLVPFTITYVLYTVMRYVECRSEEENLLSSRVAACVFGITVTANMAYIVHLQYSVN